MPMTDARQVGWNQTPLDTMTREELLEHAKAAHIVPTKAQTALERCRDSSHPFWMQDGYGHHSLQLVGDMLDRVNGPTDQGQENTFRMYFRYAEQFHFPGLEREETDVWWINSEGRMLGGKPSDEWVTELGWANDFRVMTSEDMEAFGR